jgi:hypothetical protein
MAAKINGAVRRPGRLLDRVREANRLRHGSRSTEKSDIAWIRRYILFHGKRHPVEMGAPEVAQFLSSLAVEGRVAASTQNQALSALLFLYRHVLHQDQPGLEDVVRARRPKHLPMDHANASGGRSAVVRDRARRGASMSNPLGLRGGGQGGARPALGAVVDALAEFGVEHPTCPSRRSASGARFTLDEAL